MIKRNPVLAMLFSVVVVGAIGQSIAHTGASGIVMARMESMETLADHARRVGDMLKHKTQFDIGAVQAASSAFITHGERIPMMFPDTEESRSGSKTQALPAIWSNWENFTDLAGQFTEDSRTLASLADELATGTLSEGEQSRVVRAAFFEASKNCLQCHKRYRLKQN